MRRNPRNHIYDGRIYHLIIDPALGVARRTVRAEVEPGASLIDIGCGTGELLLSLANRCSILMGVESSERMWAYASQRARSRDLSRLEFIRGDGSSLKNFRDAAFDYALACMVFHEMDRSKRPAVLREMRRLARCLILVDYRVPQPGPLESILCSFIERLAGRRHYDNFRSFVREGGLQSLLRRLCLDVEKEICFGFNSLILLKVPA